jgi:hypothetical protein
MNQEDQNQNKIEQSLCALFTQVGSAGTFALGGPAKKMPSHPGIYIKGVGPIGLPLTEVVVDQIIRAGAAQVAPFGKGTSTIVDEKVRKCWEIASESLRISNGRWESGIQRLVDEEIVPALECGEGVSAVLYKALVYETGGHFDMHKV